MAIQIDEIRAAALANESYSGSLNGQLANFYRTTGNPSDVIYLLEPEWFTLMGYATPPLSNQWAAYLANFGFTGNLLNSLQAEADAGNLFPQWIAGITYSILLEDGNFLLMEDGSHLLTE